MKVDPFAAFSENRAQSADPAARIMIVDDDPFVRIVLADALFTTAGTIKAFASGHEAIAAVDSFKPDLVLLDLRMHGLDGRATAQVLREKSPTTQLVFLTADNDTDAHAELVKIGAAGIIAKPFDPTCVVDLIQHLLGCGPTASRTAQFDAIAAEFRDSLVPTIESIKGAWAQVRAAGWQKTSAETILAKAHMLAGTAGLFHMDGVGIAADRVEGTLRQLLKVDLLPSAAVLSQLEAEICGLAEACCEGAPH